MSGLSRGAVAADSHWSLPACLGHVCHGYLLPARLCICAEDSCAGAGQVVGVPEEAFHAIETLLPTGKGSFLELWAPCSAARSGWTHIAETSSDP